MIDLCSAKRYIYKKKKKKKKKKKNGKKKNGKKKKPKQTNKKKKKRISKYLTNLLLYHLSYVRDNWLGTARRLMAH